MSIKKNTIINVLGAAIPIPLSIAVVPFMLEAIGLERYGVMAIALVILGYFGLLDLGLGRATAQKIASIRGASRERYSEAVCTAAILNIGLGIVAASLIGPLAWVFFAHFMDMDTVLREEALSASIWLSLALPLGMISGVFSGALQGLERFLAINVVNVFGTTLMQIVPLLAAWYIAPTLPVVLPAVFLSRFLVLAILVWLCHRQIPLQRPWRINRRMAGELLGFGGWVTVSAVVGPILDFLDRLIIGALVGAGAVTVYAIPANLLRRASILSGGLATTLFPRFASISDPGMAQDLMDRAMRALVAILTPLFVIAGLVLQPFISVWIDAPFAASAAPVGAVLLIGVWTNCLATLPYVLLQGTGRPDLVAKCHLAELIPYLGILAILILGFGVLGAGIAWSLRCVVDAVLLFAFASRARRRVLKYVATPFVIVSLNAISVLVLPVDSALKWQIGGLFLAISLGVSWVMMPRDVLGRLPGARWLGVGVRGLR